MEIAEKKTSAGRIGIIVACCFLMIFTGLGFCSSPKQLFLKAITEAHGIERSLFSFNDACRYLATAVASLFFGKLIAKLGTKKMILVGFATLIASQALYALADSLVLFYLAGALLGIGLAMAGSSTASYIISRRCPEKAGTLQGFVLAANGLGGALATQLVSPFIEGSVFGYRNAYWLVAGVLAAVALIIAALFREDTSLPHTVREKKARGQAWEGISYAEGLRKPYFYAAAALVFLTGVVISGVNGISTAHMRDVGIDPAYVTNIWSVHSLTLVACKFLTGYFYDKKGLRFTLLLCHGVAVAVLVALSLAANTPLGIGMSWIYSVLSPFAVALETVGIALVAGDLFGTRDYAKFLGIVTAVNAAGMAAGLPVINLVFDLSGSYAGAILAGAVLMAVVATGFQFVISAAHAQRK